LILKAIRHQVNKLVPALHPPFAARAANHAARHDSESLTRFSHLCSYVA